MAITALPSLDRSSVSFKSEVDTFFASQLPAFSVEAESARVEINANAVLAESARVTAQAALDAGLSSAATNAATATTQAGIATTKAAEAAASAASIAGGPVSIDAVQTLTNKTIHGNANTITADGTNAIGFRHIPQLDKATAYTLGIDDAGKHVHKGGTGAFTVTIPANSAVAFPIGTAITFVNSATSGAMTIAITTDTMKLAGTGNTASRTLAAYGVATVVKVKSTEWVISGTNLT